MGKSRHVALLRGINVGGKHKLPMKELVPIFEKAGATEVRTYIQSGNVVFTASPTVMRRLPAGVTSAIAKRFGFEVPVVTRTGSEMSKVARGNPFLTGSGKDTAGLSVAFLAGRPTAAAARALDPQRSPPDRFVLSGRDLYLYLPNGARSKLTNAYLDATLRTTSTVRNWNTVLKLAAMATEPA